MKTYEDLTPEEEKRLQRQLNLCAANLSKLTKMAEEICGEGANIYMDASPSLYVMSAGDSDLKDSEMGDRQRFIILESPLILGRIGAGDW